MRSGTASGPERTRWPVAAGAGGVLAGLALCTVLVALPGTGGRGTELSAWPSGVALAAACLLLGLGSLEPMRARPSRAVIAVTAGVWASSSLIAAWLQLAERAGTGPFRLSSAALGPGLASGLGPLVCVAGALAVLAWTVRPFAPEIAVAAVAALGIVAVSTAGHAAAGAWAPLLVGVHALAAAWWAGTLAALALSVRGRRGWAESLPAYSRYALLAAALVVATGLPAAIGELGLSDRWIVTGYGRVVLAKIAALAVLAALGAAHRRTWVPAAARHAVPEQTSLRRAVVETALLSTVLGLAAGLAATAP
ncbi:MAG: CopD family protein [Gordonia sp. (in: high G+C Gram-positive bacteria)]|uniref:CopD family protein n=1 Tax=Gordonia sp. (in: high G+C Gram-positive bacteria) TaxID=84139 RepID=UPI0039E5230F